ncbi:MAG: SDR family oxidoreductase [Gemmatimonadetes bacterium]|nr:SDR family oxidoreductase [Gemmatimonadota bacterium]
MTRTVVVTGGASGIGRVIAERFADAGYRVHIFDINTDAVARALAENAAFSGTVGDVSVPADVTRGMRDAGEAMGEVRVLVNDAAIPGPRVPVEEMPDDEWDRTMRVNLYGPFLWTKAVVPGMKARREGSIVNISTGSVRTLPLNRSVYNVSKWGVEGLTKTAARELGPWNVRVNAIQPGMVNNERMRMIVQRIADQEGRSTTEVEDEFLQFISMRCKVEPEDIADMAVFLSSEGAGRVTGQVIAVDGHIEWEQ